jgi:exopolysaccharide biosynthesis polyprenyl glycosylphosphotransferase
MSGHGRERGLLIPFLQVITDIICIESAFLLSYWLRFHSPLTSLLPVTRGIPSVEIYITSSLLVVLLWLFILETNGLYGVRRNAGRVDEFIGIFKSVTLGMLLAAAATFFYRQFFYSRLVFLYIWVTSILLLTVSRFTIIQLERARHRKREGLVRSAIVGSSGHGRDLFQAVNRQLGLGILMVGHIGDNPSLAEQSGYLGPVQDLPRIIEEFDLGIIFLALNEDENRQLVDIISSCTGLHVKFYLVPDALRLITSRLEVEQIDGIPLLKIKDTAITGWKAVFKRCVDIALSGVGLVVLSPLFLVIASAVAVSSGGPVLFRQERVGLDGRRFSLLKFRSMSVDAEDASGPVWTIERDVRVTAVGRFLRRFSLDELPQLINVFKGEMSLVGPRPERPHFVERFKSSVPKYLERHRVKSGMTGWAQVNGLRGNVPIEERTKFDIYYVENWSFLFDLKIIIMTMWTIITGRNSY